MRISRFLLWLVLAVAFISAGAGTPHGAETGGGHQASASGHFQHLHSADGGSEDGGDEGAEAPCHCSGCMAHAHQVLLASRPELPASPPPARLQRQRQAPAHVIAAPVYRGASPRGPPQSV
ncbi:DUF2946 family protein [Variovorax sp. DXTD-1]|uniref:DUF2946 family protein n=1 Tax=Variovorax sp. DXTD-1 TaxID=2495592 RepID=UPI003917D90C